MAKYRKKPIEIEAITFDELIEHGKNFPGVNINNGMPWSFEYKGHAITHENDELYLISGIINMTINDMLITNDDDAGYIHSCRIDIFEKTYDKVL